MVRKSSIKFIQHRGEADSPASVYKNLRLGSRSKQFNIIT